MPRESHSKLRSGFCTEQLEHYGSNGRYTDWDSVAVTTYTDWDSVAVTTYTDWDSVAVTVYTTETMKFLGMFTLKTEILRDNQLHSFQSCGTWRRVVEWMVADVSENLSNFILKVKQPKKVDTFLGCLKSKIVTTTCRTVGKYSKTWRPRPGRLQSSVTPLWDLTLWRSLGRWCHVMSYHVMSRCLQTGTAIPQRIPAPSTPVNKPEIQKVITDINWPLQGS